MHILLNGTTRLLAGPLDIAGLLESLNLQGQRLAVECNGEIVPRSRHAQTPLKDGDRIEIVHAIGGG